jgi:hypothetical protein
MKNLENKKSDVEKIAEDISNFAIEREDIKWLMQNLSKKAKVKKATVEYELQILKIIITGWSISYYLEIHPYKNKLSELYWDLIQEFSKSLSEATNLMTGCDIDYFTILKERFDFYLGAMSAKKNVKEPVEIIGPIFAKACGNKDDIFAIMTGSKMFMSVIQRVKAYFEEINLMAL